MNYEKLIKNIFLGIGFVVLASIALWGTQWFSNSVRGLFINNSGVFQGSLETSVSNPQALAEAKVAAYQRLLPMRNWQVEDLTMQAPAALSVQFHSGPTKTLFHKNEDKKLPIASLTKLMTALVALENYDLSQRVMISPAAMAQEGEQGELKAGQVFSVRSLLYTMLMESNNRAAYALSEIMGSKTFIAFMNEDAARLGLLNTRFADATGLDAKSYSTPKDLSVLTQYIFEHYPLFKQIISQKEYDLYLDSGAFHHTIISTNKLLGEYEVIGGKTGFTDSAKGCFMVIQNSKEKDNYIITIILGSEDRFTEMQNMIHWVENAYMWQ